METNHQRNWLSALAAIDVRSLAVFRMALGALILWDQCIALSNVRAFYSDEGMLPRSFLLSHTMQDPHIWSLHLIGGSVLVQSLLILITMAAAIGVIIGWRARWSLLVTWVLLCSLHGRNPTILYGGDVVLRVMAFWSLFLPMDACWSWESRRRGSNAVVPASFFGISSLAILFQVSFIYWFTAVLKYGNEWTRDGSAVYYVLNADQFVLAPGRWLLGFPDLCRWLSFGVWWFELIGPFFAFIPWRTAWWRVLVIASMWAMHLGFALCLRIGYFPVAMMALWLLFIPGEVWQWLGTRWPQLKVQLDGATMSKLGWPRTMAEVVAAVCLTLVLLWNLWTTDPQKWNRWLPPSVAALGYTLRLDQSWALFAPTPVTDDGWMICEAELFDGSHIDLLRSGQKVDFSKPPHLSSTYPDWKWHKLQVNLVSRPYEALRQPFADYLATDWCRRNPNSSKVRNWTLWFVREPTLPHYIAVAPQKVKLAENRLFISPP